MLGLVLTSLHDEASKATLNYRWDALYHNLFFLYSASEQTVSLLLSFLAFMLPSSHSERV